MIEYYINGKLVGMTPENTNPHKMLRNMLIDAPLDHKEVKMIHKTLT